MNQNNQLTTAEIVEYLNDYLEFNPKLSLAEYVAGVTEGLEQMQQDRNTPKVTYQDSEDGLDVVGNCSLHGSFVGDAIGCPECFALSEEADAEATFYCSLCGMGGVQHDPETDGFDCVALQSDPMPTKASIDTFLESKGILAQAQKNLENIGRHNAGLGKNRDV